MNIILTNDRNIKKKFSISTIELDNEIIEIEETTENDVDMQLEFKLFDSYISQLSSFGETIKLHCQEDFIYLESTNISDSMKIEFPIDSLDEFSITEDFIFSANYNNK